MSEKFDSAGGDARESQSNDSEHVAAEEKVGPVHPPRDTRWKKGGPSPNPRGRPRKDKSELPDLTQAFERAMKKKVRVSRGNRDNSMTRGEIALEQHFNQAAKGDRHSLNVLLKLADKARIDIFGNQRKATEETIAPSHQAILDGYVARRTGAANVAAAKPVLAPAELLDDEPDEPRQSGANETASQEPRAMQPAPLDQASLGRGRPPPGGFSVTTGKPT